MSTFSVFGLSYGRSGNEFCAEEGRNLIFEEQEVQVFGGSGPVLPTEAATPYHRQ